MTPVGREKENPTWLVVAGWDQVPSQRMNSIKTLSFDEIIPGNSVRVTSDNMIYAVDLVMVITGKNRNDAGKFYDVSG